MQPEVTVEYNILSSGSFYKGVFVLQIARLDFDGGGLLEGRKIAGWPHQRAYCLSSFGKHPHQITS
jgi:hypothetical protein